MRKPRLPSRLAPRLVDDLTPRQQEVLDLYQAGRSFGEIATLLGMSKSTAWQHLAYARAKLIQQYLRAQGLLGNGR